MFVRTYLIFIILLFPIISVLSQSIKRYKVGEAIEYDSIPYMVDDAIFEESYFELIDMFDGKLPYNLKRAEYLVENAYYGGRINYDVFCHEIDSVVLVLNNFIDINNLRHYTTAPNFALFEYFTKPWVIW